MAEKIDLDDIDSLSLDDVKPQQPRQHYVDNEKLSNCMTEWRIRCNEAKATGKPRPRMPEYVGEAILKISRNIATRYNFNRYSYRDEMIADAIENCCAYLHNFDPFAKTRSGKPNAFSYITRIVMNTFGNRIEKEKRQEYYRLKMFEIHGGFAALGEDADSPDVMGALEESGITQDFMTRIAEYEAKMERQREKNNLKAEEAKGPTPPSIFESFFAPIEEEQELEDQDSVCG